MLAMYIADLREEVVAAGYEIKRLSPNEEIGGEPFFSLHH